MKRIGVIGTLVWDRFLNRPGQARCGHPEEEWGGIAYSLAAFSAAALDGWSVVPLLKVGMDLRAEAQQLLESIPGLELDLGVVPVPEPTNRVELRYRDRERRTERLTGGVSPWRWKELEPRVRSLDALYVNFVSGYELGLADAQRLRTHFSGPIYADLHSLLLGRTPCGNRVPRPLAEWREWLGCFDLIQVNEDELANLASHWGDPWHFAADALRYGPRALLVTLGERGAAYFTADGHPLAGREGSALGALAAPIRSGQVPVPLPSEGGDPTGCGDVWGSTVCASLLAGEPVEAAIERGHLAAGRNVRHRGATGLHVHLRGGLHPVAL